MMYNRFVATVVPSASRKPYLSSHDISQGRVAPSVGDQLTPIHAHAHPIRCTIKMVIVKNFIIVVVAYERPK